MAIAVKNLLSAATTVAAGTALENIFSQPMSFHVFGAVTNSTGSATVKIQVSNDGTNYADLKTFTLSLTTAAVNDLYEQNFPRFKYVRGNVTAITGTGANVTLIMGV